MIKYVKYMVHATEQNEIETDEDLGVQQPFYPMTIISIMKREFPLSTHTTMRESRIPCRVDTVLFLALK